MSTLYNARLSTETYANRDENSFDKSVSGALSFLNNEYVVAAISLFLILYAGVIAPKLPMNVLQFFDNWIVQLALFFAIVYISNKNATIALIAAIAVLVTMMVVNNQISLKFAINNAQNGAEAFCNKKGYNDYNPFKGIDEYAMINGDSMCTDLKDNMVNRNDAYYGGDKFSEEQRALDMQRMNYVNKPSTPKDRYIYGEQIMRGCDKTLNMPKDKSITKTQALYDRSKQDISGESDNIDGIMDDMLDYHDDSRAGVMNAVNGGAITSKDAPAVVHMEQEQNVDDASSESEDQMDFENAKPRCGVKAIYQYTVEDETMGSALDESESLGSDVAPANQIDSINNSRMGMAEEALRATVHNVANEMERKGLPITNDKKEEIVNEVKNKIKTYRQQGKTVVNEDIVKICRQVYSQNA